MAAIYLRHGVHGAKVACSEQEAQYDERCGWERFDPASPEEPKANALAPDGDVAALREAYKAKFGKKPFAGWDADTLKAKLA